MTVTEKQVTRIHPAAKCEVCPLYGRGYAKTQFPTEPIKAAIISRSPGYHDTMANRPFAGPSGKVLDYLLKQNGVNRNEVLTTNVVLCSPVEGKVPPVAMEACYPRLEEELNNSGAQLIIAAGSESVNTFCGRGAIDSYRGYRIKKDGRTIVATNNPALVLRDDSTFPNLVKDFKRAFHPKPEPIMPRVLLVESVKGALEAIAHINSHNNTFVSADIESRGGLSHKAELVCIQFAVSGSEAVVIGEPTVRDGSVIEALRRLFSRSDLDFSWHNGIFDTKILRYSYNIPARVDEDTLLLSWACDERSGVHELEYLLMEEFAWPHYTPQSVSSFKKTGKLVSDAEVKRLSKQLLEGTKEYEEAYKEAEQRNYLALYKYGGQDAAGQFQLAELLRNRAQEHNVYDKPYKETLLAAEDVLRSMELEGIPYDFNMAAELVEKTVKPELDNITQTMQELTEKPLLNPASNKQMSALYYDDLGVRHAMQDRPDKKRSVDESSRKEIIDGRFNFAGEYVAERKGSMLVRTLASDADTKRNLIQKVTNNHERFQRLFKQKTTYLDSLIREAESDPDGRIYTHLLRHVTSTGRLASRSPNLQNVTRTKEGLPDIRGLFYAPKGSMFVQADYSQAELRTIAALSGDRLLSGVYERGEDLHNLTATRFYGPGFTVEQRANSKNMNFGVFYRQSAETFLEKHEIPVDEAKSYIDWVWSTFTTVAEWEKEIESLVHTNKFQNYTYVESPFGHRRRFYLITPENRNAIYREAINFLPQNIAANLTLHSCIELHKQVDKQQARLVLTVHDNIIALVSESYVDEYSTICQQVMAEIPNMKLGWNLPFVAEIGVGPTWAQAK